MSARTGPGLLKRASATALIAAPLVWSLVLFFSDLHERPAGRRAIFIQGARDGVPLRVGRSLSIPLAEDSIPYRGLALRLATAAPAHLALRLCAGAECSDRTLDVHDGDVAVLPIPRAAALGGRVLSFTPTTVRGGPVELRSEPAVPALESVQGYSWRLPARRARHVFQAMAGRDLFLAALAACALALAIAFCVSQVLAARTAASADDPDLHACRRVSC
jgi:hypothetical protein